MTAANPHSAGAEHGLPLLSVLVPTYGRCERVEHLLERIDAQTLDPGSFEVVIVDDGSPEPVAIRSTHRFEIKLLRQENAGPAAARNRGLAECIAPLTLILNDDALPAADLLERHVAIHGEESGKIAVLGTFGFSDDARKSLFVRSLEDTNLLFDFPGLRHGELHDWTFFWTCNISVATEALRRVGGFDERFREAIVEDVELGYRLHAAGYRVLHRADAVCEHDHVIDVESYFRRSERLGVNLARMFRKHMDPQILWFPKSATIDNEALQSLLETAEAYYPFLQDARARIEAFEEEIRGREAPLELLSQVRALARKLASAQTFAGMYAELSGFDPTTVLLQGPRKGELTSVIVPSFNSIDATRSCLEALRRCREPDFPVELIFVDNGSTDGSAAFLAEQTDLRLVSNAENLGAPRARNQALGLAQGKWLVFMDNDVIVTPGWLSRLLYHVEVNPRVGCVGPSTNRAAHGQAIEGPPPGQPLDDFARTRSAELDRRHRYNGLLSSFLVLVRREVIDAVGGFDERFSPWGFEDDDFTLRARLAGFLNRVALDVFVQHEDYGGAKLEEHERLLERNWRRFVAKWCLGEHTSHGDYSGLQALAERPWSRADLHVSPEPCAAQAVAS